MYGPVVITGAGGAIGAPLVRRCLADGVAVHVLTRSTGIPARLAPLSAFLCAHQVDWDDPSALRATLEAIGPRTVFHLAGIRFAPPGPSLEDYLESATGLTAHLLGALADCRATAIVFASSGAVYGERLAARESVTVEPASWLGVTKAMAEQLLATEARLHGRPLVTLRLFTPFGPDDDSDRLVASVIRSAAAGASLKLTSGVQTRDYVYIDDVVDAFVRAALLRPPRPQTFNIGLGCARTVREVAEFIFARFGRPDLARFGARPARPGEIAAMRADITWAATGLGWSPRFSFSGGIDRTIAGLAAAESASLVWGPERVGVR